MSQKLKGQLTKFITEVEYISRPDNPGKIYYIKDLISDGSIEDLCYILIELIEDKENDDSLLRLEDDFKTHLKTIINCSVLEDLPIAIEGLAQKYESFLKKIGYLKYHGTHYWEGNTTSAGLTGTTLKLLCEGVISNQYGKENYESLKLEKPLVNYRGVSRSLIDFMRTKLRNAVHYAPDINRKHLIPYSEIVLINYLLVVQDNIEFLGPRYLSRLALGEKIVRTHKEIEESYVKNKFLENSVDNIIRFEPRLTESLKTSKDERIKKREGTITEIFNEEDKFIIKGIGGLGKTTTLRFFSNHLIKNNNTTPLFFPLKDYRAETNLIDQILLNSEIEISEFEADIRTGKKYVFLLDGINEIIDLKKRSELLIDLRLLIKKYKNCGVVLSSRKIPELAQLDLPIFNIQPFDYNGIIEYINKNFIELSTNLIPALNKSERLLRLCSNPLLLQILCTIYENEDLNKTNNEALIIKTFINRTLERERLKNHKVDPQKLSHYLMDLGFHTRFNASVSFSFNTAIEILSKISGKISPGDDKIDILNIFKDINFINETVSGLSFNHELYQEYFAAEGLLYYNTDIRELQDVDHWRNPILMYSGLSDRRQEFITSVATTDTLLAAECVTTSIVEEKEVESDIVEKSMLSMNDSNEIENYSKGVLALLKLKRYEELKESLPQRSRDLGEIVRPRQELDGLSIVQTIIRELDNTHLLDFIQLLLDKDISYRNDIVRGLIDRDSDELKPIIKEIQDLILDTVESDINSKNLRNLITLFGIENLNSVFLHQLKPQIFNSILNAKSWNSSSIHTAIEFSIFENISEICKVIEEVDENKSGVQNFISLICDNKFKGYEEREQIFKAASISKNLLIYLSASLYIGQNGPSSSQVYFKSYNIFSNNYLNKVIKWENPNVNKIIATLETDILKKYGPHKNLRKMEGKSFSFEMKAENKTQNFLTLELKDKGVKAIWRGKGAIQFIENGFFKKDKKVQLTVDNIDYKKGIISVSQQELNPKLNPSKKKKDLPSQQKKVTPLKETLLGVKLKNALFSNNGVKK